MMRIIFECETEVAQCDAAAVEIENRSFATEESATLFAHTQASVNGVNGILRMEQSCYLRCGGEVPDQHWIQPRLFVEVEHGNQKEMVDLARKRHEEYVLEARQSVPEMFLA
jgi:hypothetical protein